MIDYSNKAVVEESGLPDFLGWVTPSDNLKEPQ